jgi:hypothetical protein
VSKEEALEWLKQEARARWGPELPEELEQPLATLAEAMAAVSATELPEEVEPL